MPWSANSGVHLLRSVLWLKSCLMAVPGSSNDITPVVPASGRPPFSGAVELGAAHGAASALMIFAVGLVAESPYVLGAGAGV